jgi:hypothetical protein
MNDTPHLDDYDKGELDDIFDQLSGGSATE